MKVRIVRATDNNWYKVGEVYNILDKAIHRHGDYFYPLAEDNNIGIGLDHFEIVENTVAEATPLDSHYDFSYMLTKADVHDGEIKVDPYFVASVWQLGAKDPSGVIFHIFKTCARFGEKNDKAREIKAIYKSIKRLAELEGVDLES